MVLKTLEIYWTIGYDKYSAGGKLKLFLGCIKMEKVSKVFMYFFK